MVKKLNIIFLLVMGLNLSVHGQYEPLQSNYMYNNMYINPANTGISGLGSVFLWHRSQWFNLEGAPTTEMLAFEYPARKTSYGLLAFYDQNGPITQTIGAGYFSYILEVGFDQYISMGLSAGVRYLDYDPSKLNIKDPGENFISQSQKKTGALVGVGVTYYTDKWYVGLSSPNIAPLAEIGSSPNTTMVFSPHIYLSGGVTIDINYNIKFRPSLVARYVQGLPVNVETSMNFQFYDKFTAGLAYRLNAAYSLLLYAKLSKHIGLGYSFDLDATEIRKYNYGSHEFFLRFSFETSQGNVRFQSPRFF